MMENGGNGPHRTLWLRFGNASDTVRCELDGDAGRQLAATPKPAIVTSIESKFMERWRRLGLPLVRLDDSAMSQRRQRHRFQRHPQRPS